jgi:hypothetical protein
MSGASKMGSGELSMGITVNLIIGIHFLKVKG